MDHFQNYNDLLFEDFQKRKIQNPAFSMRSYAKMLKVSHAHLNYVIAGKRHISYKMAENILNNSNWEEQKKELFITLLDYHNSESEQNKEDVKKRVQTNQIVYKELHDDSYIVLATWYYPAILNFLALGESKIGLINKDNSIAKKMADYFSLNLFEVEIALKRLERLELIKKNKHTYILTENYLKMPSKSSQAIRDFHKNALKLAEAAIETQDFNERDFSGLMFTLKKERLPEAKKKIESFRKEMAALMADDDTDEVYQMSIQLFKLGN